MTIITKHQFWFLFDLLPAEEREWYTDLLSMMSKWYDVAFSQNTKWVYVHNDNTAYSFQEITYTLDGPEENINKIMMLL